MVLVQLAIFDIGAKFILRCIMVHVKVRSDRIVHCYGNKHQVTACAGAVGSQRDAGKILRALQRMQKCTNKECPI